MTLLQPSSLRTAASSPCSPHHGFDGGEYRLRRHDVSSDNDVFRPSIDGILLRVERQSPVPIAQVLDVRKAGCVDILHDGGFGKHFDSKHQYSPSQAPSRALERGNGLQAIDYRLSAASGDHQSLQRVNGLGEAA